MAAKDLLLAAIGRKNVTPVEIPDVPELDGKIFVRVLTAAERHLYGAVAGDARKVGQLISDYEIVAVCACEEDGTPMFHTKDAEGRIAIKAEEVAKLMDVDGRAIHAIAMKAFEVSGLDVTAKEVAKKNSETAQTDESSSV